MRTAMIACFRRFAPLLLVTLTGCASFPGVTYLNPVIDRDFPDPAVLRAPDGRFYAYATQTDTSGGILNIQVARSRDLVRWEHLGDALPKKPAWGATKQKFWAPHVLFDAERNRYFMYYSAERDDEDGKCLAVATSDRPEGPFADSGVPMLCGAGIEHIDPMAFDDPQTGKRLLYWGSGGRPIRVQELAPDRLRFAPGSEPVNVAWPDAGRPYRSLIEGAWVTFRDGLYYLFFSGDRCCHREPLYAVMVARSRQALGPFEELEAPILEASAEWLAPGHVSVIADEHDDDWLVYHAIHPARHAARRSPGVERFMLIDRLEYRLGWPRRFRTQPSSSPQTMPHFSAPPGNGR
jgi:arabinan endo-1,5-alpha-L-arabinosidase